MKAIFLIIGITILSLNQVRTQTPANSNVPLIGSEAPAFKAQSTNGEINFPADFGKTWKILFSHPRDFTPVCSSEILELAHNQEIFRNLNTSIVVVSTDQLESHISWKNALEEVSLKGRANVKINFPLVEDKSYNIIRRYGMLDPQSESVQSIRGVFFIDPENRIRAFVFYPNEVGRNSNEIKRTLLALQANYKDKRFVLPSDWQPGDDVMLPYLNEKDVVEMKKQNPKIYQNTWFMTYMKVEE
jgi:peroxiredoxin 2/4